MAFQKGHIPWIKGKKHKEETKMKMRGTRRPLSEAHKRKIGEASKGNKHLLGHKHTKETRRKMSKSRTGKRGENSTGWKGGRIMSSTGYVLIWKPGHPSSSKKGYVPENRLVAEKELGRHLKPRELTHHRNGKRGDNRWDNLFVFESRPDHMRYERFLRREPRRTSIA